MTLQRIAFTILLMIASQIAPAAEGDCGGKDSLAGVFETRVAEGFKPNRLELRRVDGSNNYYATLISHWWPKPNDNGERGSIGWFEGDLVTSEPWSCVGSFTMRDPGTDTKCVLKLRFLGSSRIDVTWFEGECDVFHGQRAWPNGSYFRAKS